MKRRWLMIRAGDVAALMVLAAIVAALLFSGVLPVQLRSNWGFGRDWRCFYPGQGEPVCVKQVAPDRHGKG